METKKSGNSPKPEPKIVERKGKSVNLREKRSPPRANGVKSSFFFFFTSFQSPLRCYLLEVILLFFVIRRHSLENLWVILVSPGPLHAYTILSNCCSPLNNEYFVILF